MLEKKVDFSIQTAEHIDSETRLNKDKKERKKKEKRKTVKEQSNFTCI